MSSSDTKHVVVLGAGVVGLTTAVKIQEAGGYQVTIIADVLPSDPKTITYTSQWAGAQHVSSVSKTDKKKQDFEKETWQIMWDMAHDAKTQEMFLVTPTFYYFPEGFNNPEDDPKDYEYMKDFKYLPKDELPQGSSVGISFTTFTIDVPIYLNYLAARFLSKGGSIIRGHVQHIDQVIEGGPTVFTGSRKPSPPDAVVVCTGIGSRFLGGVEDKDVFPIRGQTVIVRAPWLKDMWVKNYDDGWMSYIIPRRGGDVIVGGVFGREDWYPAPRPETKQTILERGLAFVPQLVSPEVRAQRTPTIEDIDIIEDGCGLRPARRSGIRSEVDWRGKVPIVYNYGHGGYGYQSSWGSARAALELLNGAVSTS